MLGQLQRLGVRPRAQSAAARPSRGLQLRRAAAPEPGSSGSDSGAPAAPGAPALSEDMLARLRAAEEEAARLKKQLADIQTSQPAAAAPGKAVLGAKPQRIDGTDRRETLDGLFSGGGARRNSWLSEEDVDFITGGGPSEAASSSGPTAEQQALIQRRALIGGLATAGLLAFAFVPTKDLRIKPSKPLYFYLAALLRVQAQLVACREYVDNADWDTIRLILPRVTGPPGDAKASLYDAIALLEDRSKVQKAEDIAADILESLANVDSPRKYFDAMPTRAISGAQNAEFVKFSTGALNRSISKIGEFIALMPRDAVDAARKAYAAEEAAMMAE